jgi:Undecaprenyl-phosphate galactose phosphotransferase WbaP
MGGIPAVIYGSGPLARRLMNTLLENKILSYVPAVILSEDAEFEEYRGVPVIKDIFLGPVLVKKFNLKMAMVAMPELEDEKLSRLLIHSVSAFRYNVMLPSFLNMTNIWMHIRDFNGILGFASTNSLRLWWNRAAKRALDLFIVILGGIVVLPFLLVIALLVKLSSKGPVLYGHVRRGQGEKHFKAYKFRSMVQDADRLLRELLASDPSARTEWEANHKIKNDPRVTKIGKFLRKTSLDEFPQIINIFKGEMSLVGPRPIVDDEVKKYGEDYHRIFSVKPGLTGLWQVSGRSDTDYTERISYDSYYIQSWSVWLDLWVLYRTVIVVLRGKGAY